MKYLLIICSLLMLVTGSMASAEECRSRDCSNVQETYESIEYARERVEFVVDRYFNETLARHGLSAADIADRHTKASAWAAENSGHPPAHIMDAWEAEYFFKLRVLMMADTRFAGDLPTDVQTVLRTYYSRKLESLSEATGG